MHAIMPATNGQARRKQAFGGDLGLQVGDIARAALVLTHFEHGYIT
jgi:hypothetical protein